MLLRKSIKRLRIKEGGQEGQSEPVFHSGKAFVPASGYSRSFKYSKSLGVGAGMKCERPLVRRDCPDMLDLL